jgi:hypothetical protein
MGLIRLLPFSCLAVVVYCFIAINCAIASGEYTAVNDYNYDNVCSYAEAQLAAAEKEILLAKPSEIHEWPKYYGRNALKKFTYNNGNKTVEYIISGDSFVVVYVHIPEVSREHIRRNYFGIDYYSNVSAGCDALTLRMRFVNDYLDDAEVILNFVD